MSKKDKENVYTLTAELQNYSHQGILIRLDDQPDSHETLTDTVRVREDITYMRDHTSGVDQPEGTGQPGFHI
ncbi:MAG: hypothetical protein LUC41_01610 [Clostridiales bacterium]|nr:hypothetical protein [Clostridiales bacterium]